MKKMEFLFVPNNLIKMITKEMKHFLFNRRYQTNYEMILVDNLYLLDVTHTHMYMYIQTYIHTTYTRTTNTHTNFTKC